MRLSVFIKEKCIKNQNDSQQFFTDPDEDLFVSAIHIHCMTAQEQHNISSK